jgi:soluble lytic murein transglycosylase-like protein
MKYIMVFVFLLITAETVQSNLFDYKNYHLYRFSVYLYDSMDYSREERLCLMRALSHVPEKYHKMFFNWPYDYDPNIVIAVARTESGWRENVIGPRNNNGTHDYGLMQLNSQYIDKFIQDYWDRNTQFQWDNGEHSLYIGMKHFQYLYEQLGEELAIHAYNIGIGAVLQGRRNNEYYERVRSYL